MKVKNLHEITKYRNKLLSDGIYHFNKDFSQFQKISDVEKYKSYASKTNEHISLRFLLYSILFGRKYQVLSKEKIFDGNLMICTSTGNSLKIINNDRVMTYFFDENICKKIVQKKEIISKYLDTPKNIEVSDNYVIEEKINYSDFSKEEAIISVMNKYINFFKKNKIIPNKKENLFFRGEKLHFFYEIEQHGDMWEGNMLYDGNNIKVIDYEAVNSRFFLYDFLFYIYSFIEMKNNFELLDKYFEGYFDTTLERYFDSLGLIFDSKNKFEYFRCFIYCFIDERLINYSRKGFKRKNKEIDEIIAKYKGRNI